MVRKYLMLERVLRPWHSRQVLDVSRKNVLTTLLWSDTSTLATFSYCFPQFKHVRAHRPTPRLAFRDTGFHSLLQGSQTHAYIFHYYALLFTGSLASIVKAVTARALNHICSCEAVSRATRGNPRCTLGASAQLHSWHVSLADERWPTAFKQ